MSWITATALFFVVWWISLFAAIPIVFHKARKEEDASSGAEIGPPKRSRRGLIVALVNTLVAALIVAVLSIAVNVYGLSPDIFPRMIPD
jgi:predicted secreted protein